LLSLENLSFFAILMLFVCMISRVMGAVSLMSSQGFKSIFKLNPLVNIRSFFKIQKVGANLPRTLTRVPEDLLVAV